MAERRSLAPSTRAGSSPCSLSTSQSRSPAGVAASCSSTASSVPATARLPVMPVLKRTPSSSAKHTIANRSAFGIRALRAEVRTSRAAMTPKAPSKEPPFGTVSRCEPITTAGRAPPQAQMFPASSCSASKPSRPQRSSSHARASTSGSVQASRSTPPAGNAPNRLTSASSRSSRSPSTSRRADIGYCVDNGADR